jgi:hypothetical protein
MVEQSTRVGYHENRGQILRPKRSGILGIWRGTWVAGDGRDMTGAKPLYQVKESKQASKPLAEVPVAIMTSGLWFILSPMGLHPTHLRTPDQDASLSLYLSNSVIGSVVHAVREALALSLQNTSPLLRRQQRRRRGFEMR